MDDNQELIALGMSHLLGCFFSSLSCSVSLSRSSVASTLDSKTPLFNVYSTILVLLCLFFLADWISYIPNSVLATVVIVNLFNSFKSFNALPRLWRCSKPDFWAFVVCTVVMILFGAEMGLIAGVVASFVLLWVALRTTAPRTVKALDGPHDAVVASGTALHFLNRDSFLKKVERAIATVEAWWRGLMRRIPNR